MAEISEAGYENLRDSMEGNPLPWKYIELQTSTGLKITRRQIGLAGRGATLEARENGGQTIVFKVVVNGGDPGMPTLPVTVAKSVIKDQDSDEALGLSIETLSTSFTFQESADQLTVYHKVQVPEVV